MRAPGHRRRYPAVAAAKATVNAVRDGVVAVPEVLVEDLPTDLGAGDDVADRQLVDRTLMGERERCVAQPGADPFGAGIDAVGCVLPYRAA